MSICPHSECCRSEPDSWFDTDRAMNIHYGCAHEGSISKEERECIECDSTFSAYKSNRTRRCHTCQREFNTYNKESCPTCGEEFMSLGVHWKVSKNCDFPELSSRQWDILTGMLMGDATVQKHFETDADTPKLAWSMITEDFLSWLDSELGVMTLGGYDLDLTAEESAQGAIESGLTDEADPENYSDMYINITRTHPDFERFADWYDSEGTKRFPLDDIELTPMTLKVWYVCDGTLNRGNPRPRARIAALNESDSIEELSQFIYEDTGIETTATEHGKILFNTEETEEFFEYIGDPLPGFEYKWPEEYR